MVRRKIFNTDQGSQFTAASFIDVLQRNQIRISMDGRGAWRDNVFVEGRLWKSVKYEEVYLDAVPLCCGGQGRHYTCIFLLLLQQPASAHIT